MGTSNQKACGYHFFFDSFSKRGMAEGVCSGGIEKLGRQICSQAACLIQKRQRLFHLRLDQNRAMQQSLCIHCCGVRAVHGLPTH